MNNFIFQNPTEIIFGKDTVGEVGKRAAAFGKKILLVTGGGSVKKTGLYDRVMDSLQQEGLEVFDLSGVKPNPRIDEVRQGIAICKDQGIDLLLAVGGGSTIDTTKAIAAGFYYQGDPWEMFTNKTYPEQALPLAAILTLAATGSEGNGNAVISNMETNQKLAIQTPLVAPKFSILDPTVTYTVPKEHTVYGIVDIAAHVYEQYFKPEKNTVLQDRWAEAILKTLFEESQQVLEDPEDYNARANIMLCGTMALNGTIDASSDAPRSYIISLGKSPAFIVHAIEHQLSAFYDIPHGGGLAILYPNWMKYTMKADPAKFAQYAARVFDLDPEGKSDEELALLGIEKTREWFNSMDAPARLADYDIDKEHLEEMAARVTANGTAGDFMELDKDDVLEILRMSL